MSVDNESIDSRSSCEEVMSEEEESDDDIGVTNNNHNNNNIGNNNTVIEYYPNTVAIDGNNGNTTMNHNNSNNMEVDSRSSYSSNNSNNSINGSDNISNSEEETDNDDDVNGNSSSSDEDEEPTTTAAFTGALMPQAQEEEEQPALEASQEEIATDKAAVDTEEESAEEEEDSDDDNDESSIVSAEVTEEEAAMKKSAVSNTTKTTTTKHKSKEETRLATATRSTATTSSRSNSNKDNNKTIEPSAERFGMAAQARSFLFTQVRKLPFKFGDSTIYNFGCIKNESTVSSSRANLTAVSKPMFSSTSFIHPVGFDCIHCLYSPTHGRMLKLRCEILDGPLFRISWGRDVDEYRCTTSEKFMPCRDTSASSFHSNHNVPSKPEVGMRCRVRFDEDQLYDGIIVTVSTKKKSGMWEIKIQYDDGGTEDADYPDEEIELLNYPSLKSSKHSMTSMMSFPPIGKNAHVVCCPSALEAWATVLIRLGLIDEVIFARAIESLQNARKEGKAEVKGRLELVKLQRKQARERQKAREAKAKSNEEDNNAVTTLVEKEDNSKDEDDEDGNSSNATPKVIRCVVDGELVDSNINLPEEEEDEDIELDDVEQQQHPNTIDDQDTSTTKQEQEQQLKTKLQSLTHQYDQSYKKSQQLFIKLSNLRIASQNPFLHNPFESDKSQQLSWLGSLIKKEKLKMGSTGNKRKILTPTDLLEKMDTFFGYIAPDLDRLIEGLPGSEFCPSYVFHASRSGGASSLHQSWIHEIQIKQDKDAEKDKKAIKEAKEKEIFIHNKELKRKEREEERIERKKQKIEEVNQKKKTREEERLSRLNIQVEDRLFKEACFQREKVVLLAVKALSREFMRRRKAAELFSSSLVEESHSYSIVQDAGTTITAVDDTSLPPLSTKLDEDVIKLWDFLNSFSTVFYNGKINNGNQQQSIVSLEVLQQAIDSLKDNDDIVKKKRGMNVLIHLAITLSQPLSSGLIKLLATVVSTTPVVVTTGGKEKDATENSGNNTTNTTSSSNHGNLSSPPPSSSAAPSSNNNSSLTSPNNDNNKSNTSSSSLTSLPVNVYTWKEVARLSLLADALNELSFSKQDSAHILRGHRSGGHPLSKEARRLRQGEDYVNILLRQNLVRSDMLLKGKQVGEENKILEDDSNKVSLKIVVAIPCSPRIHSDHWLFYLFNIQHLASSPSSSSSSSMSLSLKNNLRKALSMLRSSATTKHDDDDKFLIEKEVVMSDLHKALTYLEQSSTDSGSNTNSSSLNKAKHVILRLLDKLTGEIYSKSVAGQTYYKSTEELQITTTGPKDNKQQVDVSVVASVFHPTPKTRLLMGYVKSNFKLTQDYYRQLTVSREEYMPRALREKKKRDRKEKKKLRESGAITATSASNQKEEEEEDFESDDDDDDDDDDVEEKEEEVVQEQQEDQQKQPEEDSSKQQQPEEDSSKQQPAVVTGYKIGKVTPYDVFCADDPSAHELIRRCLAVTRTLCISAIGEAFIYPVDPQSNPRYYETVLRPMCLQDIGKMLQVAGKSLKQNDSLQEAEDTVAQFSTNVRLIAQNCASYSNVGAAIVSSSDQLMRLFERLLLDWILAPPNQLTPLELLNDDNCIGHHESDLECVILLCDGCEGKYNMARLDPPLTEIPQGDWYCLRCLEGRCWADLDPRIGLEVKKVLTEREGMEITGTIKGCLFLQEEGEHSKPSLMYTIQCHDGKQIEEKWTLEEVDVALKENGLTDDDIPPVRCLEALSESCGYGILPDNILPIDFIPSQLNPNVSDASAQAFLSSSTFRDSIQVVATLALNPPEEMNASEWLKLLTLLSMKCATSEDVQEVISKKENEAAEKLAKKVANVSKVKSLVECVKLIKDSSEEDESSSDEEEEEEEKEKEEEKEEEKKEEEKDEGNVIIADETKSNPSSKRTDLFADSESSEDDEMKGSVSDEEEVEWKDAVNDEDANDMSIEDTSAQKSSTDKDKSTNTVKTNPPEQVKKKRQMKARIKKEEADIILQEPAETVLSNSTIQENGETKPMKQEEISIEKQERNLALRAKSERSKAREDSFLAYGIKQHVQASISSFEEDNLTPVIDSSLSSKDSGLSLDSNLCSSEKCQFCGLTDVALGLPLMRVPSKGEWEEMLPHLMSRRVVRLIAEVNDDNINDAAPTIPKLKSVSVRINGELQSWKDTQNSLVGIPKPILEFTPRNPIGFQHELFYRQTSNFPYVTGSLSAHECCALSVHNARTEKKIWSYREQGSDMAERDYGRFCGRTLPIGKDKYGRIYWSFHGEPSLFVCLPCIENGVERQWHRYSEPEEIASVIVCLGKQEVADEIKRLFPKADRMIRKRKWMDLLQKRVFKIDLSRMEEEKEEEDDKCAEEPSSMKVEEPSCNNADEPSSEKTDEPSCKEAEEPSSKNAEEPAPKNASDANEIVQEDVKMNDISEDMGDPFEEGEEVLVESRSGKLLWDAAIVAVSKNKNTDVVNGYRVHYTDWNSRFDEWVEAIRVVEPSDNNVQVQVDMLTELIDAREGFPEPLESFQARKFIKSKNRARGTDANLSQLREIATFPNPEFLSTEATSLTTLKALLLMIESALPEGSIATNSSWAVASSWRSMVQNAKGAATLMGCLVLLEDELNEKWMRPHAYHLLSCMPRHWKAVQDASLSAVALRIWILDSGIQFAKTEKLKCGGSSRQKKK